jgi:hypothetical protein
VEAVRADERRSDFKPRNLGQIRQLIKKNLAWTGTYSANAEVVAFYWTVLAPDIVNPGREEQGSVSV